MPNAIARPRVACGRSMSGRSGHELGVHGDQGHRRPGHPQLRVAVRPSPRPTDAISSSVAANTCPPRDSIRLDRWGCGRRTRRPAPRPPARRSRSPPPHPPGGRPWPPTTSGRGAPRPTSALVTASAASVAGEPISGMTRNGSTNVATIDPVVLTASSEPRRRALGSRLVAEQRRGGRERHAHRDRGREHDHGGRPGEAAQGLEEVRRGAVERRGRRGEHGGPGHHEQGGGDLGDGDQHGRGGSLRPEQAEHHGADRDAHQEQREDDREHVGGAAGAGAQQPVPGRPGSRARSARTRTRATSASRARAGARGRAGSDGGGRRGGRGAPARSPARLPTGGRAAARSRPPSPSRPHPRRAHRSAPAARSGRTRPRPCRRSRRSCWPRTGAGRRPPARATPCERNRVSVGSVAPMSSVAGASARIANANRTRASASRALRQRRVHAAVRLADQPEAHRRQQHDDDDDQLQPAVQPQRPRHPVGDTPADRTADREPAEEPGQDRGHRLARVAEHEDQLARPDHLVDQAGGARQDEQEQQRAGSAAAGASAPVVRRSSSAPHRWYAQYTPPQAHQHARTAPAPAPTTGTRGGGRPAIATIAQMNGIESRK